MIVTHQMQTAEIANVIFVMEQGSIVDHGLFQHEIYRNTYKSSQNLQTLKWKNNANMLW
ncbi:hypothetical protein C2W64_04602 [Brevibacillus laterosporus]|nr:hypothetical protein C2W64_04602 [Brevibacillus laterosporus]